MDIPGELITIYIIFPRANKSDLSRKNIMLDWTIKNEWYCFTKETKNSFVTVKDYVHILCLFQLWQSCIATLICSFEDFQKYLFYLLVFKADQILYTEGQLWQLPCCLWSLLWCPFKCSNRNIVALAFSKTKHQTF